MMASVLKPEYWWIRSGSDHRITPYRGGVSDPMVLLRPEYGIGSYHRIKLIRCRNSCNNNDLMGIRVGIGSHRIYGPDPMVEPGIFSDIGSFGFDPMVMVSRYRWMLSQGGAKGRVADIFVIEPYPLACWSCKSLQPYALRPSATPQILGPAMHVRPSKTWPARQPGLTPSRAGRQPPHGGPDPWPLFVAAIQSRPLPAPAATLPRSSSERIDQ